jgi:phenylpyruvate tautomerase PptA (4-oxalocrotonate tautomerase family)
VPHLDVYALEADLAGREEALIGGLTEAVVAVYGEWARESVVVRLIGLPPGRWGIGGQPAANPAPSVAFGINEKAPAPTPRRFWPGSPRRSPMPSLQWSASRSGPG